MQVYVLTEGTAHEGEFFVAVYADLLGAQADAIRLSAECGWAVGEWQHDVIGETVMYYADRTNGEFWHARNGSGGDEWFIWATPLRGASGAATGQVGEFGARWPRHPRS